MYVTKEEIEAVSKLPLNEKVTIIKNSEFGFPSTIQCKITRIVVKPYAQFSDACQIFFKRFKDRKERYFNFHGIDSLVVYKGWIKDQSEVTETKLKSEGGYTLTKTNYTCLDSRNITDQIDANKKLNITPIFSRIRQ